MDDKASSRPKLRGSLFLGVRFPLASEPLLLQPLTGILERRLTWLRLSISHRTPLSTASPASSKNPCHSGRSFSRLPDPSPDPLEEEYSALFMRPLSAWEPQKQVQTKAMTLPFGAFSSSSTPPQLLPSGASIISSCFSLMRAGRYAGGSYQAPRSSENWRSISTGPTVRRRASGAARVTLSSFVER